jgi:hypothetical protein
MAGLRNPFGRIRLPHRALPHRVKFLKTTDLEDDAGGRIPQPTVLASGVPAWVQDLEPQERMEFSRLDVVFTTRVITFTDPGPLDRDDLVMYTPQNRPERTLRVKTVNDEGGMGLAWTIMCEEVKR